MLPFDKLGESQASYAAYLQNAQTIANLNFSFARGIRSEALLICELEGLFLCDYIPSATERRLSTLSFVRSIRARISCSNRLPLYTPRPLTRVAERCTRSK